MVYNTKREDDTVAEEASAVGQRVKGAAKDGIGAVTGNDHSSAKVSARMRKGEPDRVAMM